MKKILLLLLILNILSLCYSQEVKPRVGVLEFSSSADKAQALVVEKMFRVALVRANIFDVLNRENMDTIFEEIEFQQTGCTESSCAVEIGKILNMNYMIYGSLTKIDEQFAIQIEAANIETTRIVYAFE